MKPLPTTEGGFGCIVADCPWAFDNQGTRAATDNHYQSMTLFELAMMNVADVVAENAHLYLWHTAAHLPEALVLMKAWGFRYVMQIHWAKINEGKLQMGLGNYFRHCTESLLFGTRGRAPAEAHDELNFFWSPRQEHSQKPEELQDKAERVSRGPYLELFGRRPRFGWTVWGNEVTGPIVHGAVPKELGADWAEALKRIEAGGNDFADIAEFNEIDRQLRKYEAETRIA